MSIWLQRLASIRPRTSLPKFQAGVSFTLQFHIPIPPTCAAVDFTHDLREERFGVALGPGSSARAAASRHGPSSRQVRATSTTFEARSRLYRRRFLQPITHFAAFLNDFSRSTRFPYFCTAQTSKFQQQKEKRRKWF